MTADQLTPQQRDAAGPILDGRGWGFGVSVIDRPESAAPGLRGSGWGGGFGTAWVTDPEEDLVAILCTQVLASAASQETEAAFWSAAGRVLDR